MFRYDTFKGTFWAMVLATLALAVIVACGSSAPAPDEPAASSSDGTAPPQAQIAPTAMPAGAEVTSQTMTIQPAGSLNVGLKELGNMEGHPSRAVNPGLFVSSTAPLGEPLLTIDINRQIQPWLAESWSISDDFITWTFKIPRGVQFHKGYGEMTAEDVVWSYTEGWAENQKHARNSNFRDFWLAEGGSVETPDRYTVVVDTGTPLAESLQLQRWIVNPSGVANWVASKRQSEELGVEAANLDPALTGSWEIVEARTGQFWKMRAVEDHWRKTPEFAELVFFEIPEESSRLAGFQTGNLDTFIMAFDSIPVVEKVPGAKLLSVPGGLEYGLNFYGGYLVGAGTPDQRPAFDPELPWVSGSADLDSEEWKRAVKVRQALSIAIDRETIIDTILRGFGRPELVWFWGNFEHQLGDRRWEFDPARAKQLLAEAGYPDGFTITLTTSIRGAPAETEACEAVAVMWGDVGIDVKFQRIPYGTFRPQAVARTYQGATCHAAGAQAIAPNVSTSLTTRGSFSLGSTHSFIEEIFPRIEAAVDPRDMERLQGELGTFLFDNAYTMVGLYLVDAVWPVGPRIEEWSEHVLTSDLRNINGYEWIEPRQ